MVGVFGKLSLSEDSVLDGYRGRSRLLGGHDCPLNSLRLHTDERLESMHLDLQSPDSQDSTLNEQSVTVGGAVCFELLLP